MLERYATLQVVEAHEIGVDIPQVRIFPIIDQPFSVELYPNEFQRLFDSMEDLPFYLAYALMSKGYRIRHKMWHEGVYFYLDKHGTMQSYYPEECEARYILPYVKPFKAGWTAFLPEGAPENQTMTFEEG